jgi:hypothetical protein
MNLPPTAVIIILLAIFLGPEMRQRFTLTLPSCRGAAATMPLFVLELLAIAPSACGAIATGTKPSPGGGVQTGQSGPSSKPPRPPVEDVAAIIDTASPHVDHLLDHAAERELKERGLCGLTIRLPAMRGGNRPSCPSPVNQSISHPPATPPRTRQCRTGTTTRSASSDPHPRPSSAPTTRCQQREPDAITEPPCARPEHCQSRTR